MLEMLIPLAIVAVAGYGLWRFYSAAKETGQAPADIVSDTVQSIAEPIQNAAQSLETQILGLLSSIDVNAVQRAQPYVADIAAAEREYGIPDNILTKVIYQESRFRQDIISGKTKSGAGATGIAQFMPATAKELGLDPLDPVQSIDKAGAYLSGLYRQFGDWSKAVAAYNWGAGNVARKGLKSAPTETVDYVKFVTGENIRS